MIDGFGLDYLEASDMPNLKSMTRSGFFREAQCVFPSVTNVNNVSITTRAWPVEHGVTGNSYYDAPSRSAKYMNAAEFIQKPTVFGDSREQGGKTALFTSKRKTTELFRDADVTVAGEAPPENFVKRLGTPGSIYSREVNYWLWQAAIDTLRNRPDIRLTYVHTTDYPMHMWRPDAPESQEHLATLDRLIGDAAEAAPDAAFFVTADHGMNAKTRCWDLTRVCHEAGVPLRFALSPEADYYVRHHRNFTGCAYLWLNDPEDYRAVAEIMGNLDGVEEVLTGADGAARFHLAPERVGDMVVLADKTTMFGDMENAFEALADTYRAHGSVYEMDIPLVIHNFDGRIGTPAALTHNKDILKPLYAAG